MNIAWFVDVRHTVVIEKALTFAAHKWCSTKIRA
jgi:hypothetical protein